MDPHGLKVDLHVHSKFSKRPSQWILQKIDCPESFSEPEKIYTLARQRGMDLVTVSDHNSLDGSLEIAHLEGTFLSEEVTTYFPEDRCKLHVLALDITEDQHREISRVRENVYDLVGLLRERGIVHVLAHPFYSMNDRLTPEHFERLLLLFELFELNGARNDDQNQALKHILSNLSPEVVDHLADKHNLEPVGEKPWLKGLTAGSDDHSSLNIARSFTFVPGAETREDFFRGLREHLSEPRGTPATPKTMAHNLYGIAYQFYKSKFQLDRYVHKNLLLRFIDTVLTGTPVSEPGLFSRLQEFIWSRRTHIPFLHNQPPSMADLIQREGESIIAANPRLRQCIHDREQTPWTVEKDWFDFVNDASERIISHFADSVLESLSTARFFNLFQTIGSAASVYSLTAPFFVGFRLFTQDWELVDECLKRYGHGWAARETRKERVAVFSDTFSQDGEMARHGPGHVHSGRGGLPSISVLTCGHPPAVGGDSFNFDPVGSFELPDAPDIKLHYPPVLEMLKHCYKQGFSHIHASTPGPMGLAALLISRILDVPLTASYDAAFAHVAADMTGDFGMEELVWKYLSWFYAQMKTITVPSRAAMEELASRGVSRERIQIQLAPVDTGMFHPAKRNGFWKTRHGLDDSCIKLLHVGRLSLEDNLDVLVDAFSLVARARKDAHLVVVGDGPYLSTMRRKLKGLPCLFAGRLEGDDLAMAYASSDLFITPSTTDVFGEQILEAQSSGLPAIVSDRGGARENLVAQETGLVFPAYDAQALFYAVMECLDNPGLLTDMSHKAREYSKQRSLLPGSVLSTPSSDCCRNGNRKRADHLAAA